jgi:TIR domain
LPNADPVATAAAPQPESRIEAHARKQLENPLWLAQAGPVVQRWKDLYQHDLSQPGGLLMSLGQGRAAVVEYLGRWRRLIKHEEWHQGPFAVPACGELVVCCVLVGLARYIPMSLMELEGDEAQTLPPHPVIGFDDPLVAQLVAACLFDTPLHLPRAHAGAELVSLNVMQGLVDPQFKHLAVEDTLRLEALWRSDRLLGVRDSQGLNGRFRNEDYLDALTQGVPDDEFLRDNLQALQHEKGIQLLFLPMGNGAAGQWLTPERRKWLQTEFSIPSASHGQHLLAGQQEEYEKLKATVNAHLQTVRRALGSTESVASSTPSLGTRRKVFLSYSHKEDLHWLEEIKTMLGTLKTHLELWHDGMIEPGTQWHPTILKAVEQSQVALLLVSKPFLASDYVREHEFPAILKRHNAGLLDICPLLVGSIDPGAQPWFSENQLFDSRPLRGMDANQADEVLTKVSVYLRTGRRA